MMNPRSPASSTGGVGVAGGYPSKRARLSPSIDGSSGAKSPVVADPSPPGDDGGKAGGQSSSFRNVSACNRCRLRKNRCDQRLPSCASCEKAGVKCVGYDPITKREIPRSYVFYLESRISYLESLLQSSNIPFAPAEILDLGARPSETNYSQTPVDEQAYNGYEVSGSGSQRGQGQGELGRNQKPDSPEKLDKLASNMAQQGASDPRYLGSTSGISFARVVFAAVKSSVSSSNSEKGGVRPSKPLAAKAVGPGGTSMRDSFFGLQTKPNISQAPFPDKEVGLKLATLYFEHANPQVPILHRGEFMKMFESAYSETDRVRTSRELYMLNIVYAIGAGIIMGEPESDSESANKKAPKRLKSSSQQCQPEEYHASAVVHLEACLSSTPVLDRPDGFGGGLEELQAVLLLAGFALLRPVAPGLWYITGVAVRLAVDLGLHYEDGKDLDIGLDENPMHKERETTPERMRQEMATRERGRREWVRDFRRRLWWCTYSFDRLVSACVGRPFGITDQVITTEFPSLLEDTYITPQGFLQPPLGSAEASSKIVAYHYFRFRLLQSEILQVLQHQQAQLVRAGGANQRNPYMHTSLPSPFLSKFGSFRSWRIDVDRRLWQWKESSPTRAQTGVQFSTDFLDLNYWQAIIMLYRQSLSVPPQFEGEFNTSAEVESPSAPTVELREDEDQVFLKVAEAGQKVLRLYRSLHRVHLVNYTFLATHHLFMAGISFLYAIWHSPVVRSRLTMDEVDFTILAATSVLGDMIDKCPPAEACRDAFNRMSKATVQMCLSTTGFSSSAQGLSSRPPRKTEDLGSSSEFYSSPSGQFATSNARSHKAQHHRLSADLHQPASRPKLQFDMGLNDLFPSTHSTPPSGPYQTTPPAPAPRGLKPDYGPDSYGIPRNQVHSPQDYALEARPPSATSVDTSAIDPSLLPSPQAAALQLQYQSQNMYHAGAPYAEMEFGLQGMDFLQGYGGQDGMGQATAGMDLGFGLGWEGIDHDFSEGNQVDLFDGFFFGNG